MFENTLLFQFIVHPFIWWRCCKYDVQSQVKHEGDVLFNPIGSTRTTTILVLLQKLVGNLSQKLRIDIVVRPLLGYIMANFTFNLCSAVVLDDPLFVKWPHVIIRRISFHPNCYKVLVCCIRKVSLDIFLFSFLFHFHFVCVCVMCVNSVVLGFENSFVVSFLYIQTSMVSISFDSVVISKSRSGNFLKYNIQSHVPLLYQYIVSLKLYKMYGKCSQFFAIK